MSDRDITLYVVDILIAANKISRYVSSFSSATEFLHSELEWDASIRELQLIGEAVNILIKEDILDRSYRRIVDFRNQVVHGYFGIDEEIVWSVVQSKVPSLAAELIQIINTKNISISNAIEAALEENSYNHNIVAFLKSL